MVGIILVFVISVAQKERRYLFFSFGAVAAAVIVAALMVFNVITLDLLSKRGWSYRPDIWAAILESGKDTCWFGNGVMKDFNETEAHRILIESVKLNAYHAHNTLLQLFHDGGVVAVSLFLFAVYYMFKDINARCGKKERFWIYFILIGLVFINLTDSSKFVSSPKESWVMLWFPMVFIAAWLSSKESFQKAEAGQEQVSQTCARRIQKTI